MTTNIFLYLYNKQHNIYPIYCIGQKLGEFDELYKIVKLYLPDILNSTAINSILTFSPNFI